MNNDHSIAIFAQRASERILQNHSLLYEIMTKSW